jgi:hypothetical protein
MSPFDPRKRELCPDGACIGVIGPDGTCKECGRPGEMVTQDRRNRGLAPPEEDEDDDFEDEDENDDDDDDDDDDGEFRAGERQLCPNSSCIGIIGPDGRCKECGSLGPTITLNPRTRGLRSEEEIEEELEANIATSDIDTTPEGFSTRQLCPDGSCIGIIGRDGRCRECGASADPASAENDNRTDRD